MMSRPSLSGLVLLAVLAAAGGALRPDLVRRFDDICRAAGARFVVMYGQTEATARMARPSLV